MVMPLVSLFFAVVALPRRDANAAQNAASVRKGAARVWRVLGNRMHKTGKWCFEPCCQACAGTVLPGHSMQKWEVFPAEGSLQPLLCLSYT